MLRISLTLTAIVSQLLSYGQIAEELDRLFFSIPLRANKNDVREAMDLNGHLRKVHYWEEFNSLYAYIYDHPYIQNLGESADISVWFDGATRLTQTRAIWIKYTPNELGKCKVQHQQLCDRFKNISYAWVSGDMKDENGEKNGTGIWFYSSLARVHADEYYLRISYEFVEAHKPYYMITVYLAEGNV